MAEMVMVRGANGGNVLVNLDNVLWIDTMNTEKGPRIGCSAITMLGMQVQLCVQGTPEELYQVILRQKHIEIIQ